MNHYNILFSVLLPFVIVSAISRINIKWMQYCFLIFFLYCNIHFLRNNFFHDWSKFDRIFTHEYYHQRPNQNEIEEAINLIPPNASVSAGNYFTPYLSSRDKIYFFPDVKDAEYIAVNEDDTEKRFYPFESSEKFEEAIKQLKENSSYEIFFEKNKMLLFKKK